MEVLSVNCEECAKERGAQGLLACGELTLRG
jgi:hypothetical protein